MSGVQNKWRRKRKMKKMDGQLAWPKLENDLNKNRQLVHDFVSTRQFKVFIIATIVFNAVLIAMISPAHAPVWLSILLDVCTVIFFMEMVLKMYAMRMKYFDDPWNLLDFATVLGSIIELIVFFFRMAINAKYEARTNLAMTHFRLVRVLRLLAPTGLRGGGGGGGDAHGGGPAAAAAAAHVGGHHRAGSTWRVCRALLACRRRVAPVLLMAGCLYALMAVYALNSLNGLFAYRCMDDATGEIHTSELCHNHSSHHDESHGWNPGSCTAWRLDSGAHECAAGFTCVDTDENPNLGGTSFDNFLMAYLTIFQISTLGGWKDVLWASQATLNWAQYFIFLPIVFLGGFVAVNMVTATVVIAFNDCMDAEERGIQEANERKSNSSFAFQRALEQAAGHFRRGEAGASPPPLAHHGPGPRKPRAAAPPAAAPPPPPPPPPPAAPPAAEAAAPSSLLASRRPSSQVAGGPGGGREGRALGPLRRHHQRRLKLVGGFQTVLLVKQMEKERGGKWETLAEANQILTAIKEEHLTRSKSNRVIKTQWRNYHNYAENRYRLKRIERLEQWMKHKANDFLGMAPDAVVRVFTLAWNGVGSESLKQSCIAQDSAFNLTMNGLIVVNIICLACEGANISTSTQNTLTIMEYVLLCIFTYEMGLKLLVLGIHGYCSRHENVFDASVVLISWPLVSLSNDNGNAFLVMYRICARLLKIFRIGQLYKRFPAIQRILQIGGSSIQNLIPVCFLLLLYTFVLAVVGVQIFGSRLTGESEEIEQESWMRYSFKNFLWSWVTLYYVIVGENWQAVLYIAMNKVSKWAALYFVFVVVTGSYVGLNLLTAVVLDCVSANHAAARLGCRLAVSCNHALRRVFLRRALDRLKAAAAAARAVGAGGGGGPGARAAAAAAGLAFGGASTRSSRRCCCRRCLTPTQSSPRPSVTSLLSNQSDQSPRRHTHSTACLCPDNDLKFNFLRKYNRRHLHGDLSIIHGTMNRAPKFYVLPFDLINTLVDNANEEEVKGQKLSIKRKFTRDQLINKIRRATIYSKNCTLCNKIVLKYQRLCVFLAQDEKAKKFLDRVAVVLIIVVWVGMFVKEAPDSLWWLGMGITSFFLAEVLWKSTANGFLHGSNSYVKNKWNLLDLFIVVVSFAELLCYRLVVEEEEEAGGDDLDLWVVKFRSVLLVAKSLRPLRLIVLLEPVRRTVDALLLSLRPLGALTAMVVSAWALYAIVGLQLYKGLFDSCSHADFPENTPLTNCDNSSFTGSESVQVERSALHFDNFFASMGAVFVQATLIGWQPILFDAMDATSDGNSPKIYNTPEAFMYFLIGTFVFGILAVNLLMGAIFDSFIQIKDKVSGKDFGLDVEQKKLRSHEEHLMALRPIISDVQAKSQFRRRVQAMVNSNRFKYNWIILVLLVQTLVLCATHVGQSDQFTLFQVIVSHCVAVLFLVEAVLKLYGHGVKPYFCRKSNIFDFVISLIGLLDLILFPNGCGADINLLTRLRALRIFRLFPLLSHSKRLHFLTTIMEPLPAMLSVLLLMSYVAFFYANLGVQLYSGVKLQADRSTTYIFTDFRDLRHGFEVMTILATGDSWTDFLIEFIDQSQDVNYNITYIFFGSYFVIQVWILVNMFVLFIVENFELMNSEDIQRREIIIKGFKMAWAKYDPEGTGRIRRGDLPALLVDVPAPLGVARDDPYLTLAQTVDRIECQPCFFKDDAHMEIQDWLGFNDVLVSMCAIAFHPLKIVANDIPDIQLLFQKSIAEQIIRTFLKKTAAKHNAQKNSNGVLHKQAPNKKSLKQERQSDQTRETESLSTTSSFNK